MSRDINRFAAVVSFQKRFSFSRAARLQQNRKRNEGLPHCDRVRDRHWYGDRRLQNMWLPVPLQNIVNEKVVKLILYVLHIKKRIHNIYDISLILDYKVLINKLFCSLLLCVGGVRQLNNCNAVFYVSLIRPPVFNPNAHWDTRDIHARVHWYPGLLPFHCSLHRRSILLSLTLKSNCFRRERSQAWTWTPI